MRSAAAAAGLLIAGVMLAGCMSTPAPGAAPRSESPSPLPTAACPEQPGVELPPECAPYDPDQAMAQNDLYRERMDIDAQTRADGESLVAPVTAALEALRASGGAITERAVAEALSGAGVEGVPQTRAAAGDVLFGTAVGGGCLFGAVTPEAVSVEVGGFILDGGCLPAR